MEQDFSSDHPVANRTQDSFQRYGFSKRIAETIIQRVGHDGIVLGLYGAWGEGKTSILNFISKELSNDDSIIQMKFNPWRYTDEDSLIKAFFSNIATTLNKELNSGKEKVGNFLKKYGAVGKLGGFDVSEVGKAMSEVSLGELKSRVDEFLKDSTSKLVVFIDDIDRLDKQEIYSLFKLVKLNAEFTNTTYVLSFDENMVAAAIGERYGKGDITSGFNFLEKIIQVPIRIPQAPSNALRTYSLNLVENCLKSIDVKLTTEEVDRFITIFTQHILLRIKTPRLAVRYSNTLLFSIPLLKGEVNLVDLMLVEALKIFYPDHYNFIKNEPQHFLHPFATAIINEFKGNVNKKELNAKIEALGCRLVEKERHAAQAILANLFPTLDNAVPSSFTQIRDNDLIKDQRIASDQYFQRYFSYVVLKGELSDIEIQMFFSSLSEFSSGETIEKINDLIGRSSASAFITKLRNADFEFDSIGLQNISIAISALSELFPDSRYRSMFGSTNLLSTAVSYLIDIMARHKDISEAINISQALIEGAESFKFSIEMLRLLHRQQYPQDSAFNEDNILALGIILIKRALDAAEGTTLFELYPDEFYFLVKVWNDEIGFSIRDYVVRELKKAPSKVIKLMFTLTPLIWSSSSPQPYKGDLEKESVVYLDSLLNIDDIHNRITEQFGDVLASEEVIFWDNDPGQSPLNLLRQFEHWYREIKAKQNDDPKADQP